MTIKQNGYIICSLHERIRMFPKLIQSITIGDTKIILWNTGKSSHQIETIRNGNTKVFNFESDHHTAVCELIMQAREINNEMA